MIEIGNPNDWRMLGVTTLSEDLPEAYPGGPSHKAGSPVYVSTLTRDSKGELLGFICPSPTSLALNIAINEGKKAYRLNKTIAFQKGPTPLGESKNVAISNSQILFDYFEACMVSVAFSMQSLEIFSNTLIADNLKKTTLPVFINKKTKQLNATEIQTKVSVSKKIDDILPRILKIDSPRKQDSIWNNFLELKRVRDTTIHMKASDAFTGSDVDRESLFFEFFRINPMNYSRASLELINHFDSAIGNPHWIKVANDLIQSGGQ